MHRQIQAARVEPFSPSQLAAAWADAPFVALLENPGDYDPRGRYAYVCRDPFWLLRTKRRACWSGPPRDPQPCPRSAFDELSQLLARFRGHRAATASPAADPEPELPPFRGGAVGYLGYELLYLLEDIPDTGVDAPSLPDAYLLFYDLVFAHDALEQTWWVIATGFGPSPAEAADAAAARLREGRALLATSRPTDPTGAPAPSPASALSRRAQRARRQLPTLDPAALATRQISAAVSREGYLAAIASIQADILAGRVFEVCLTQRFDCDAPRSTGADLHAALRTVNPAPMSAYLRFPEFEVLSASPERFVSLDRAGVVETRPIKGTRPRGASEAEDAALRGALERAPKDRAENLMIVDLCRNDLGKVCEFGSIEVSELCGVHPYAFTWQMVSTIRGSLRAGLGPVDLLRATFPGGSMTGAPKIEAMTIIDALEPTKRGVFSGAIGYLDFDGALDLSIVIRTFIQTPDNLSFHVGGAIVADSDPAAEYQETLDKAHGLVLALDMLDLPELSDSRDGGAPP